MELGELQEVEEALAIEGEEAQEEDRGVVVSVLVGVAAEVTPTLRGLAEDFVDVDRNMQYRRFGAWVLSNNRTIPIRELLAWTQ